MRIDNVIIEESFRSGYTALVWPYDEMRRHDVAKQHQYREIETSRKAQTEVDEQSAERFETTQARSKARREPRIMEKGNHGDRLQTVIRSAKVRKLGFCQFSCQCQKLEGRNVFDVKLRNLMDTIVGKI